MRGQLSGRRALLLRRTVGVVVVADGRCPRRRHAGGATHRLGAVARSWLVRLSGHGGRASRRRAIAKDFGEGIIPLEGLRGTVLTTPS